MRSRGVGYTQVPNEEPKGRKRDSEYKIDDQRFEALTAEIPYASVALAIGLMIFGILCFVLAWMHFTQQLLGKEQAEFGFMFLGILTFMPGFYHSRLAYYAWKGCRGYTWDKIPSY
ncbi:hypothetical protein CEUSTIGMA_g4540.t1 [Chlamydomonas eustigma]|uniref:Uncharacterized protein n=1 Tax=Chlamydomonas eustigma TaxID=1157962 RepID=A0A250X1W9_9CHLO|nr:hypothetical protein CEUSTIGMA_g4540.t1 [Chlamydomonas eustigma]|eukprot:GAX77094.1 hypothetical protein CEUSTIGMA_g4540.t1 [Chlamydomonas eustigma]